MKHISHTLLDPAAILAGVKEPKAGAIVLFSGEVRNHSENREVLFLEYDAHESMANSAIEKILTKAKSKWSLHQALCVHRLGRVDIGESSVVVITAASHRKDAYGANQFIIDELKRDVPIWKREYFVDGQDEWK